MKEIHVVGAAITDGTKILAAQRSEKMKEPLKWEFVGGKVEPGETHQQALVREVQEELGIHIQVGEHIATGTSESNGSRILLHVYRAQILKGQPQAAEHTQIRWVEASRLMELDWPEADLPACEKIVENKI